MTIWLLEEEISDVYRNRLFIVRAETEEKAREIASVQPYMPEDDDPLKWLDPRRTRCVELVGDGPVAVLCRYREESN